LTENSHFVPSKDDIWIQKTPTSLHKKKTGYDVSGLYIFCVDVHMALIPPPVHRRPSELTALRVDVINGWPLCSRQCRPDWL